MRFVIYGIFLVGWCTMWWWTYTCHIKVACCEGKIVEAAIPGIESEEELVFGDPIGFELNESEVLTGAGFTFYRDSLIARLDSARLLEITGYYTSEELQVAQADLGLARAGAILEVLAPQLSEERFQLYSMMLPGHETVEGVSLIRGYDIRIREVIGHPDSIALIQSH